MILDYRNYGIFLIMGYAGYLNKVCQLSELIPSGRETDTQPQIT